MPHWRGTCSYHTQPLLAACHWSHAAVCGCQCCMQPVQTQLWLPRDLPNPLCQTWRRWAPGTRVWLSALLTACADSVLPYLSGKARTTQPTISDCISNLRPTCHWASAGPQACPQAPWPLRLEHTSAGAGTGPHPGTPASCLSLAAEPLQSAQGGCSRQPAHNTVPSLSVSWWGLMSVNLRSAGCPGSRQHDGMAAAPMACRGLLWHLGPSAAPACLSQKLVGAENLPKIGLPLGSQQCS